MNRFPARLHVLLSKDMDKGVVLRRGPSKQVCTVAWNRREDRFRLGQWLKGRIFERRSDLSPDGGHMIYFAMNGKWSSKVRGAWTAISRAPYLKAVGLWAKGDCWHGGGLFSRDRRFWLNDGYGHKQLLKPVGLERQEQCPFPGGIGGECLGVYYPRLLRDGWRLVERGKSGLREKTAVFDKALMGSWRLRKLAHETSGHPIGKGCYYDEHELVDEKSGQKLSRPSWEWAEFDGIKLIWAEEGCLFSAPFGKQGPGGTKPLKDFNDMKFEAVKAPY